MPRKPIPVVDLFAGPGGLGEGFSRVKYRGKTVFKTVISVEKDPYAHMTLSLRAFYRHFTLKGMRVPDEYRKLLRAASKREMIAAWAALKKHSAWNQVKREALCLELGEHNNRIRRKITKALGIKKGQKSHPKFVLIGGPPCQAYSLVGRSRMRNHDGKKKDPRHFLYKEYLAIIRKYKPVVFVMENVKGLNTALVDGKPILPEIIRDLESAGYELSSLVDTREDISTSNRDYLIRAENYGVPQTRHRVIIVGKRVGGRVGMIEPLKPVEKVVNLKSVIGTLPKLIGLNSDRPRSDYHPSKVGSQYIERATRRRGMPKWLAAFIAPQVRELSKVILNHEARSHMSSDLVRYRWWAKRAKKLKRSPTVDEIPARDRNRLLPKHANLVEGKASAFVDRFKVQVAGRPSGTITSHISKDGHYYIHYDPAQARSFSVREAARIQTFPDDYFFMGNRTQQYHQVGNAVPPFLAYQIGQRVWSALRG
jgi:DNA (cytosine-5)-methyltransferase 1